MFAAIFSAFSPLKHLYLAFSKARISLKIRQNTRTFGHLVHHLTIIRILLEVHMHNRALTKLSLAIIGLIVAPQLLAQSPDIPRTEYGQPDFQGTYTFRTLTPLNRPRELADKATLTPEEAVEWEAFERRRQTRDLIIDPGGGAG